MLIASERFESTQELQELKQPHNSKKLNWDTLDSGCVLPHYWPTQLCQLDQFSREFSLEKMMRKSWQYHVDLGQSDLSGYAMICRAKLLNWI